MTAVEQRQQPTATNSDNITIGSDSNIIAIATGPATDKQKH